MLIDLMSYLYNKLLIIDLFESNLKNRISNECLFFTKKSFDTNLTLLRKSFNLQKVPLKKKFFKLNFLLNIKDLRY
jgi:hypothetical protein